MFANFKNSWSTRTMKNVGFSVKEKLVAKYLEKDKKRPFKQHKTSRNIKILPHHDNLKSFGACFGVFIEPKVMQKDLDL